VKSEGYGTTYKWAVLPKFWRNVLLLNIETKHKT